MWPLLMPLRPRASVPCYNHGMAEVTQILSRIEAGDPQAAEALLPLVYRELRKLAAAKLARERPGQTLQATALVHEAYLRLVSADRVQDWNSCGHFFMAAAEAMRRILVERARKRGRLKHGRGRRQVEMDVVCLEGDSPSIDLLALDEALAKLAAWQPAKAELVKLRYFAGLNSAEAAQALGVSLATAERYWAFARAWLYAELAESTSGSEN